MDIKSFQNLPFNIDLLTVKEEEINKLKQVKEIQIFDNNNNFHPDGLFSTVIFGGIGTEYRKRTFGYIDLKTEILHPLIYYAIITLKSFYKDILSGSILAEWDNKTKQFIKSNKAESNTGYSFFMEHITELQFEETGSEKRHFFIELFNKAIKDNKYKIKYFLVLPAGLRDYTIDANGKPQEDEINTYYRKLISQSNLIDPTIAKKTPSIYDSISFSLQNTSLTLFEYLKSLLEGKNKLILGKWLTRKIFNSTRNVLSSYIEKSTHMNDPNRLKFNQTVVGLHQFLRCLVPKTMYEIKNKYIKDIFIENNSFAYLTNAKTLKREEVLNTHIQKDYDLWTSPDGLEKVIASFGNLDIRHIPITLNKGKHYLGLIYTDDKYFKFLQDIDNVPEGINKENIKPITLAEFLYISIYHLNDKIPTLITRYPITGYGSIYPTYMKIKTTNRYKILEELDHEWKPSGNIAHSFPIRDLDFFNTLSVHNSHLQNLGADFDGDTISCTALLTEESMNEIKDILHRKEYYISPNGNFYFSNDTDVLSATLSYMTGD